MFLKLKFPKLKLECVNSYKTATNNEDLNLKQKLKEEKSEYDNDHHQ